MSGGRVRRSGTFLGAVRSRPDGMTFPQGCGAARLGELEMGAGAVMLSGMISTNAASNSRRLAGVLNDSFEALE